MNFEYSSGQRPVSRKITLLVRSLKDAMHKRDGASLGFAEIEGQQNLGSDEPPELPIN